jgi:hypothetical protein
LWGPAATPAEIAATSPGQRGLSAEADLGNNETHLRSCREVAGYALEASDGNLGHIEDFLFDDLDWSIRYVMIDTRNWWFGKKVVISPEWVDAINWSDRTLGVEVSRETVKGAPAYDAVGHVNRQWEADYYAHHQRLPYWISADRTAHQSAPPADADRHEVTKSFGS